MYVYICMHLPGPVLSRYSLATVIHKFLLFPCVYHGQVFPSWERNSHQVPCQEGDVWSRRAEQRADRSAPGHHTSCQCLATTWLTELCSISWSHAQLHIVSHQRLTRTSEHPETSADRTKVFQAQRSHTWPTKVRALCAGRRERVFHFGYFLTKQP